MFFAIFVALIVFLPTQPIKESLMLRRAIPSLLTAMLAAQALSAEEPQPAPSLVDHVQADSIITINLPEGLRQRLSPSASDEQASDAGKSQSARSVGYRVQLYSDNNARTAKTEAQTRARNIAGRFPQYRTYVVYNAPFWRLKVGDFRSQQEANSAAAEIKRAFPSYSREVRVVRDRIANR